MGNSRRNTVIPFGTLLQSGGPPDNGDMEARVKALEETVKDLPTKADFAELRAEFSELRADVKAGMSDLRAEMHKANIDIHKWMIGTVIGLFLGFGGLFLAMSNALKQPATTAVSSPGQQTQHPPIIINVPTVAPAPQPPAAKP